MKSIAMLSALVASAAFAQILPPIGSGSDGTPVVTQAQLFTQAPVIMFVADGGSDSNPCTSSAAPCFSIQGAYDKIPKTKRHPTTISIGPGVFPQGAFIEGDQFVYSPTITAGSYAPDAGQMPSLTISGTLQLDTIASGLQDGGIASATAGSLAFSAGWGTATVTDAGWTVNDLSGRFFQVTGGTGAGQVRPIVSNTATVATIVGQWVTTPDATSSFAIVVPATTVKDGLKENQPIPINGINADQLGAAFIVRDPSAGQMLSPQIILENMIIDASTNGRDGIAIEGSSNTVVQQTKFIATANASGSFSRGLLHASGPAENVGAYFNVFAPTSARNAINLLQGPFTVPVSRTVTIGAWGHSVLRGNYIAMPNNTADGILAGAGSLVASSNYISGGAANIDLTGGTLSSAGNYYNAAYSGGYGLRVSIFADGDVNSTAWVEGDTFQGNTGTGLYAVSVSNGAQVFFNAAPLSVTGWQTAYRCTDRGFIVGNYTNKLPTPTGTTVADMVSSLSGATYSMTTLNAASPRTIRETQTGCVFDNQ